MTNPLPKTVRKNTRIQREKQAQILDAALKVFSTNGFSGSTLDQIADQAGLSKPNVLYYFPSKEAIHRQLINGLLENWLTPLREIDPTGEPLAEIWAYVRRKLQLAKDFPRESRLFANEILQGGPRISDEIADLKVLVDEKAGFIAGWVAEGRITKVDPHHLIFSIWATTQHYADFEVQVRSVLGIDDGGQSHFDEAEQTLHTLFVKGLEP